MKKPRPRRPLLVMLTVTTIAFAFLATGGCLLTTDLDGLAGPAVADGSTTGGDATSSTDAREASSDADAATRDDAAAEGGCPAATVAFCDDFERADVLGGWTEESRDGGTLAIAGAPGARYLEAAVVGRDAGDGSTAIVRKRFTTAVTSVTLECDLAYDKRPATAGDGQIILAIHLRSGNALSLVYLDVQMGLSAFVLQTPGVPGAIDFRVIPLGPGAHRIAIGVAVAGRTTLRVDGATVLDFTTPGFMVSGTPTLEVGISGLTTPSSPLTVTTDNVVFSAN